MKQSATKAKWITKQKRAGHEIRYTPNGHPYAVLKRLPPPPKQKMN